MKEEDIRPDQLFQKYLELSKLDAAICFEGVRRMEVPCVACGSNDSIFEFKKNTFDYRLCSFCGTLFQSPRPDPEAFTQFYENSVSSQYWADKFFPAVAESRRKSIFRVRVESLAKFCHDKKISFDTLIDVGAGFGIFLEEWRDLFPTTRLIAIEPSVSLAQNCRKKGFEVLESFVEKVQGCQESANIVTCYEVLEHVYNPLSFLQSLKSLIKPGGHVFVTALGVDGFDIQVLWEKSNSIFPPHHINFLSVAGFKEIFKRAGFVDVDVTTPGALDVDIVRNAVFKDPDLIKGQRFIKRLIGDTELATSFQRFLVKHNLSSHTWIIARKPSD